MKPTLNSAVVGLGETPTKRLSDDVAQLHLEFHNDPCWRFDHQRMLSETDAAEALEGTSGETGKRLDYIDWNDYFMAVACLSAQRSKDPSTQVGACIVSPEKKIVGMGYNGMPRGCGDDELPWGKTDADPLKTKYAYVCHAEMNAIMNKISADLKGCTIYVALFPCNECAKLIIQSGISSVVFMADKPDKPEMKASKILFDMAKISYTQFVTKTKEVCISLQPGGLCRIVR